MPADPEVLLAARFAELTGVPWNSVSAVQRITSKWETRRTLVAHGLRQPEHFLVTDVNDARVIVSGGGAWMVKPERGTASEGVSKVTEPAHVEQAVENLRRFHPSGPFVVERCIAPMIEYSVEGVWFDRAPVVVAITAKRTTGAPHFVETGHTVPDILPTELDEEIRTVVTTGLLALGASHGQFHVEVFVQPEQLPGHRVTFGEGHVRAGGDRITQILALAGLDLDALAVDAIIGRRLEQPPQATGAAASRYLIFPPGTVVSVEGVDEAVAMSGVEHLSIDVGVGDVLKSVVGNGSRHARFVVAGANFDDALALADQVEQTIRVEVDPTAVPGLTPASHSMV